MTVSNPQSPTEDDGVRRRLFAWPLSLFGMTAALLAVAWLTTGCGGHREPPDIDEIKEHVADGVEHVMWRLDGTDEQTERIQAILADTIDELATAHGPRDAMHGELARVLTAETIDRAAMETLRQEHVARSERLSRVITTRLADVLEVLTPEQRAKLNERLQKHRGRRGWH